MYRRKVAASILVGLAVDDFKKDEDLEASDFVTRSLLGVSADGTGRGESWTTLLQRIGLAGGLGGHACHMFLGLCTAARRLCRHVGTSGSCLDSVLHK